MSSTYIPAALRREVAERAKHQCEYCLLPANVSFFSHEIDEVNAAPVVARRSVFVDHVIAQKHGGQTEKDVQR